MGSWLADPGLRDNSVLVFMDDNGTAKGETVFNAGMRGKKGSSDLGEPRSVRYASRITDISGCVPHTRLSRV